ncbi:IQ domain-containing protein E isoform X2 [Lepus europaeus]|uniref:IQ domain-containing protein E isoform X2 n=1 Tax=Lepus europaeus TaxID=9983 RepID=UPI002B4764FF|nr:IQ domain-containing protein E isoform X2 [Lepus europaeus]
MSLDATDPVSETGDDTQSAATFDSDSETKAKRKSVHRPPPTSPKSPYYSEPRKGTSWRSLKTAGSMPLSSRTSLSPQKLWLGTARQGHVPGTPVYREKEDMYDEIIELKKVINGLRQRIFKLEQQCKEKDTTINKLQTDMKTTNLEEMRLAMETYYEEIHRLQTLLASSEPTGKKPAGERKTGARRQKKTSSTLLSLSRSVQELTEENQSLKEDLDRVLSSSPAICKVKGYVEWSKPRLLRRIAELEKKINSVESSKAHAADVSTPNSLAPSASTSPVHRQPPADCQEDLARLRGAVKSLKGERGTLQAQLLEKDVELRRLLQAKADLEKHLESAREGERQRRGQEQALREEIQALTTKLQELEETRKGERAGPVEVSLEAQERPASPASSRLSLQDPEAGASEEGVSRAPSPCVEGRRDAAARVLQTQWRLYKHKKKQTVLDEEAAVALQAAFRGHLTRAQLLSRQGRSPEPPGGPGRSPQDSPTPRSPSPVTADEHSPEAAIVMVQSVLRGHLARARLSATSARKRPASGPRGTTPPPPRRTASPGEEDGEASGWEATEDLEEPATPQARSARSSPSGPQPRDDVDSDDSDDVVIAPLLPTKKSSSHPRFPSPPPSGNGCQD